MSQDHREECTLFGIKKCLIADLQESCVERLNLVGLEVKKESKPNQFWCYKFTKYGSICLVHGQLALAQLEPLLPISLWRVR